MNRYLDDEDEYNDWYGDRCGWDYDGSGYPYGPDESYYGDRAAYDAYVKAYYARGGVPMTIEDNYDMQGYPAPVTGLHSSKSSTAVAPKVSSANHHADTKKGQAHNEYKKAAAMWKAAHPQAAHAEWLVAAREWDASVLADRALDKKQAGLNTARAEALSRFLPPSAPSLHQEGKGKAEAEAEAREVKVEGFVSPWLPQLACPRQGSLAARASMLTTDPEVASYMFSNENGNWDGNFGPDNGYIPFETEPCTDGVCYTDYGMARGSVSGLLRQKAARKPRTSLLLSEASQRSLLRQQRRARQEGGEHAAEAEEEGLGEHSSLCQFIALSRTPASAVAFTPEAAGSGKGAKIQPAAQKQKDTALAKTLARLDAAQAKLNTERLRLYTSLFGASQVAPLLPPSARPRSAQHLAKGVTQLSFDDVSWNPQNGFLRWDTLPGDSWRGPTSGDFQGPNPPARWARKQTHRAAKPGIKFASTTELAQDKLAKLGVNTDSDLFSSGTHKRAHFKQHAGQQLAHTAGEEAQAQAYHKLDEDCINGSPSTLCDHGVHVGEKEIDDWKVKGEGLEGPYLLDPTPQRESSPNTLGGDWFGHMGEVRMTKEEVQEQKEEGAPVLAAKLPLQMLARPGFFHSVPPALMGEPGGRPEPTEDELPPCPCAGVGGLCLDLLRDEIFDQGPTPCYCNC